MNEALKDFLRQIPYNYDMYVKLAQFYLDTTTAPVAAFSADATVITAGTFVAFTNTSTGEAPLSQAWDFGDGGKSSSESPNYQYNTPGFYTVALVVADKLGAQASEIKINYIEVTA